MIIFRERPKKSFYLVRAVLARCQNPHSTNEVKLTWFSRILSISLSGISGTVLGLLEGTHTPKRS